MEIEVDAPGGIVTGFIKSIEKLPGRPPTTESVGEHGDIIVTIRPKKATEAKA